MVPPAEAEGTIVAGRDQPRFFSARTSRMMRKIMMFSFASGLE